jgi:methionine salvage enolase-phosphatase E1
MSQAKHPVHGYPLKDADGRKSVQEIVREQLAANGQEQHFKKVYETIHKLIASNKFRILRKGDSLFLYGIRSKEECHFNLINADTPKNLIRNFQDAYNAIKAAGFKKITFESDNPKIVEAAKNTGINIQPGEKPGDYIIMVNG